MQLEPKDLSLGGRVYVLTKFPATAGREIIAKYPLTAVPKLGDYAVNEETMLKLMSYVWRRDDQGNEIQLTTRALVDNHVPNWEDLAQIEVAMLEYNCSFFGNGGASRFLDGLAAKLQALTIKTLTDLSQQLSAKKPPRSPS